MAATKGLTGIFSRLKDVPAAELLSVAGPWGQANAVREERLGGRFSLAANWRRTVEVRHWRAAVRNEVLCAKRLWIGGGELWNTVTPPRQAS